MSIRHRATGGCSLNFGLPSPDQAGAYEIHLALGNIPLTGGGIGSTTPEKTCLFM